MRPRTFGGIAFWVGGWAYRAQARQPT